MWSRTVVWRRSGGLRRCAATRWLSWKISIVLSVARPDLLAQEPVGHRVVVAVDLDVVVEPDGALLPLRIFVGRRGQRLQRRALELLEQLPAAGAEVAGDALVERDDQVAAGTVRNLVREALPPTRPRSARRT
jgi:hypothetical protein